MSESERRDPSDPDPAAPQRPRLLIVVASTRPGRVGPAVADWVRARAVAHGGFEVAVADLAAINLPLLDEPNYPRLDQYTRPHTMVWSATVDAADALIFVMPEYNHGYTAPLKNAIDYLYREWQHKPVGLVSYGGVVGGTRAVQQLKPVLAALRMAPMVEAVPIPYVQQYLTEEQRFVSTDALDDAATAMLMALARWTAALRPLRAPATG